MFESGELTRLLEAISDPARMKIVFLLKHHARLNVGEIAAQFRISRPAISHHLKVLKEAGVVQNEKIGQEIYYWIDRPRIVSALRVLADIIERTAPDEPPAS